MKDTKILFVRQYDMYGRNYCDIVYKSNRLTTLPIDDIPKTVKAYMNDSNRIEQYDKVLKTQEILYTREG